MVARRRFRDHLRVQVMLIMIVVLMLPLGGVGWYYFRTLSADLGEIEKAHALEVGASAHRLFDQLGEQLSSSVITNAKWKDYLDALNAGDIGWIEENINVSNEIIPNVGFVATADYEGRVVTQSGDIPEFTGELKDKAIVASVQETPDVYGMIRTSRGLAIVAASRITDEESTEPSTGVLIFGRLLDDEAIEGIGTILNAPMAIRSADGQTLGSSSDLTERYKEASEAAEPLIGAGEDPRFETGTTDGKRASLVASGYPGMAGDTVAEIIVSVPAEASGTVRKEMLNISGIAGMLAILLILLIAVVLRRRILVPLVGFEAFLKDVSAGNLSGAPAGDAAKRRDEIGSIARSLKETADQLRTIVSGIRATAAASSSAAGRLTEAADFAADGASRIADTMREVSAGADSQVQGMRRGADVAFEILSGMTTIGERSSSVAAVAEQASRQALEGNDTVGRAVAQMEIIADTAERSVKDANELHDKSERIGRLVEAIAAIAYKTNLLALNANIEASRAGEHGKGFAVVAEEVRKLALQADRTAKDIAEVVEEVRKGIGTVVRRIGDGHREVQSGTARVREAGRTFEGISAGIRSMEGELQDIASAGQEIGARLEELSSLVGETEAISESSAERAQEVAEIAESQMVSVRKVATGMGELADRIKELEQAVNRFK